MRFLIGFLVTIGLLIVVFVLIFRGASNNDSASTTPKLVDYSDSSVVMQFTEMGPVSANQTHDEVRITVSDVETAIEIFKGYEGNLISSKTYANNSNAYADFLSALDLAGYTQGNTDKSIASELGACQAGSRYIEGIKDGDKDIQRFWSSTCKTGQSFKGNTAVVRSLFVRQVPDYETLTRNLQI